jgi:DNA-binding NtrC family response regulator
MGGAGHTVLVVDDDDSLRMLCRINLELEGYRVLEAPTVETAQQLLHDEDIDVVLLDVHVGSGDGFSVLGDLGAERVALFTGSFQIDKRRGQRRRPQSRAPSPSSPRPSVGSQRRFARLHRP